MSPKELGRIFGPTHPAWSNLQGAVLTHANGRSLLVVEVIFRSPYCTLVTRSLNGGEEIRRFNTDALARGAFTALNISGPQEVALQEALALAAEEAERVGAALLKQQKERNEKAAAARAADRARQEIAARAQAEREYALQQQKQREHERVANEQALLARRVEDWQQSIRTRRVTHLTHFTRLQNLRSILKHGILPRSRFAELAEAPLINDEHRLDGYGDAVSLSVTHPNDALFVRWRVYDYPKDIWVVLLIRASVLWEIPCELFCANAALGAGRNAVPLQRRHQPFAADFETLFAEPPSGPSRDVMGHSPGDTTDPQAEVMAFGKILCDYIEFISVREVAHREEAYRAIADVQGAAPELRVEPGLFNRRRCAVAFMNAHKKAADDMMAERPVQGNAQFDEDLPV